MYSNFDIVKKYWDISGRPIYASDQDLKLFENQYGVIIPNDLKVYFKTLNGTQGTWDEQLFEFYPLDGFKTIKELIGDFGGIPDYKNIVKTLNGYESCFCFADYSIKVFTYAVKLHNIADSINEVYVICGDKYQIVANSFMEFIDKYIEDASLIMM